jgi:hypothetical protein
MKATLLNRAMLGNSRLTPLGIIGTLAWLQLNNFYNLLILFDNL